MRDTCENKVWGSKKIGKDKNGGKQGMGRVS